MVMVAQLQPASQLIIFSKGSSNMPASTNSSLPKPSSLTNRGGASAADIAALARAVQQAVKSAFGVDLVPEPVCVGVL